MDKCFYCKGEMRDDFCNYMVDWDGHLIIVKHVPCHKCSWCGEVSYSGEVVGRIEEIVTELKEEIDTDSKKDDAFRIFKDKMNATERFIQEYGYYSEEEVEEELAKI